MCDCFWSRTVKLQRCFRGPTMSRQCLWRSPAQLRQSRQEITEALRSLILAAQDYPSVLCGKQSTMKQPCKWKGKMSNLNCNKRFRLAVSLSPSPSRGFRRVAVCTWPFAGICFHSLPVPPCRTMPDLCPQETADLAKTGDWPQFRSIWNSSGTFPAATNDTQKTQVHDMSMAALNTTMLRRPGCAAARLPESSAFFSNMAS